jgi:hypothetical protein
LRNQSDTVVSHLSHAEGDNLTDSDTPKPSDDWTDDFLRWADDRWITIGFADYLDQPPREVWRFELGDVQLDAEDAAKELLRFTQQLEEGVPFALHVKRSYQSWAADSAAFEITLMVSSVVLNLLGPEIMQRVLGLLEKLGVKSANLQPLSRDEALRQAKFAIGMIYAIKHNALEVRSEEEDRQRSIWVIGLSESEKTRYTVEVGSINGHPFTRGIKREIG